MTKKDIQIEFERLYTSARGQRSKHCAPRIHDYQEPYQGMWEAFQEGMRYGLRMAKEGECQSSQKQEA